MTDTNVLPAPHERAVAPAIERRGVGIAVLYAVTSFVGAALLFMVQPLAAKLILPSFGGSATVWSTSSLFFQVLLLLGYLYAHLSTRRFGAFWQPRAHVLVLLIPLLALPIALPTNAAPDADASPAMWLLRVLAVMVGLPFLVLSATGPLIQRWYSWSRGPRADDPYFLFAGSNLGSFVGLLSYPLLIEPTFTLSEQKWGWSWAFVAFLVLMAACATTVRSTRGEQRDAAPAEETPRPTTAQVLTWGALAFLPSCLMLAVTSHISTDVAPIPLVWVLPLAVYLASFVAAFARTTRQAPANLTRVAVAGAFLAGVVSLVAVKLPIVLVVSLDVALVALVGYAAHSRLATTRPAPGHLTTFYLVISAGGALGGLVNGVVAPLLFNRVWEYGLTLAAVPLLMVGISAKVSNWITRRYHPAFRLAVGLILTLVVMLLATVVLMSQADSRISAILIVIFAVGAVGWLVARAPVVLALSLLIATATIGVQAMTAAMLTERTFYGSYRVIAEGGMHKLVHGTTVHGIQWWDKAERDVPTAYYAQEGPLGDVMSAVSSTRTGIVGLGAGGIAAYARPGDHFTYYEIDPAIARVAEDHHFFSFMEDSPATIDVVLGDGRLKLEEEPEGEFDLLILDAFSSDSIPVHLLTREALKVYLARLSSGGTLVVHVSNRIFDLKPVLAAGASDAGLVAMAKQGGATERADSQPSEWVVLSPSPDLRGTLRDEGWSQLKPDGARVWTDDYASVLSALKWSVG